jgi:hypothetical protein
MRRILAVLFLLALLTPARAAVTNVDATVTWTNVVRGVTNGDTITVTGSIRRYTNGVLNDPALWIQSTNIVGHAATNSVVHFNTYSSGLGIDYISFADAAGIHLTNAARFVSIIGSNLTITLSAGVGTVTYTTNVYDQYRPVAHPSGGLPTAAARTNNQSGLFGIMNDSYATNVVANSVPGLTNLLDRVSYQEATNKTFRATTNSGGLIDGARITNSVGASGTNLVFVVVNLTQITNAAGTNVAFTNFTFHLGAISGLSSLSGFLNALTNGTIYSNVLAYARITNGIALHGTVFAFTNGYWTNGLLDQAKATNFYNTGDFWSASTNVQSTFNLGSNNIFGSGQSDNYVIGDDCIIGNSVVGAIIFGSGNFVRNITGGGSFAFGHNNEISTNAGQVRIFGSGNTVSNINSVILGEANIITNDGVFIFGTGLTSSEAQQVLVGGLNSIVLYGRVVLNSGITNLQTLGFSTNVLRGDLSVPRSTVTTIANGHNTINVGTNVYVDLTGAPSVAWTWGGITGGNRDGKLLKVRNSTGFNADILHNSGTEPTASLRITTPTSTNITLNNSGWAEFLYDPSANRWQLVDVFNTATPAASATNALASLSTNGVQVTGSWTNLNLLFGTNVVITATNTSGNVDLRISATDITHLFTITNDVIITNQSGPISVLSNLLGTATLPANFWQPGMSIEIQLWGKYFATGTLTQSNSVYYGANLLATNSMPYFGASGDSWNSEVTITCRTIGASGSLYCHGLTHLASSANGVSGVSKPMRLISGAVPVDTTAATALDYQFTPGATTTALHIHAGRARVTP